MIRCNHLLVAIDFSALADKTFGYGRELSELLDARLHVIHVVEDLAAFGPLPPTYVPGVGMAQHEIEERALARLEAFVSAHNGYDAAPAVIVRISTSPAAEILAYVKDHPIDLVIVGSHGHRAMTRLLLGSVAERVVRSAPCPVLTVRDEERDFVTAGPLRPAASARRVMPRGYHPDTARQRADQARRRYRAR